MGRMKGLLVRAIQMRRGCPRAVWVGQGFWVEAWVVLWGDPGSFLKQVTPLSLVTWSSAELGGAAGGLDLDSGTAQTARVARVGAPSFRLNPEVTLQGLRDPTLTAQNYRP